MFTVILINALACIIVILAVLVYQLVSLGFISLPYKKFEQASQKDFTSLHLIGSRLKHVVWASTWQRKVFEGCKEEMNNLMGDSNVSSFNDFLRLFDNLVKKEFNKEVALTGAKGGEWVPSVIKFMDSNEQKLLKCYFLNMQLTPQEYQVMKKKCPTPNYKYAKNHEAFLQENRFKAHKIMLTAVGNLIETVADDIPRLNFTLSIKMHLKKYRLEKQSVPSASSSVVLTQSPLTSSALSSSVIQSDKTISTNQLRECDEEKQTASNCNGQKSSVRLAATVPASGIIH